MEKLIETEINIPAGPGPGTVQALPDSETSRARLGAAGHDLADGVRGVNCPAQGAAVFDPAALVEEVLHRQTPLAQARGVELACDLDPATPPWVLGDPEGFQEVLSRLVSRAIRSASRGDLILDLKCSEGGQGHNGSAPEAAVQLSLAIQDPGPGLCGGEPSPPEGQPEPEESPWTAEWVPDEVNRFAARATFARARECPVDPGLVPPEILRGRSVLVVDDSVAWGAILARRVEGWGMNPQTVHSGRAALEEVDRACAARRPFEALLLDVRMPGMGGLRVVEELGKKGVWAGPVVLMMPSPHRRSDSAHCRRLGITALVSKPVRRRSLLAALAAALS